MSVIHLLSRLKELQVGIRLENDRLKLNVPDEIDGALCDGLLTQLKENREAIIHYLQNIQKEPGYTGIEPVEKKDCYELSSTQRRLYILQQMESGNISYNMPQIIPLVEAIEPIKLENTFKKIIARHESLRTSFEMIAETLVQRIHQEVDFAIEYYEARKNEVEDISKRFTRPFDLSQPPLLRVGMEKKTSSSPILLLDMHHIITDGISQTVLEREFMSLYRDEELLPLRLQYKDFAQWQNSDTQREAIKKQEEYWRQQFAGEIPILNMPIDYMRPDVQSFEGSEIGFKLSEKETKALNEMARINGTTLFMVLLAVYNIFLSNLSNQEDIVVGAPIAGRKHADLEQIIGMFVNTLALRNYPFGEKSFLEFLSHVKARTLDAFENQDYQFEDLVEKVNIQRDVSRNPLFDVTFTMQNFELPRIEIPGLNLLPYEDRNIHPISKFDLTLQAVERDRRLLFTFEYNTALFKETTVERFIKYFKNVISGVLENMNSSLSEIEIISPEEKSQLLYDFNDTAAEYPEDKTIPELFEQQVEKTADHTAVSIKDKQLTYRELKKNANGVAHQLRDQGIKTDSIVGIIVKRSLEMVVGIMGILKAGGAYLSIEPEYPEERIKYILEDSKVRVLVTTPKLQVKVKAEVKSIYLTSGLKVASSTLTSTSICQVSPANLAYIIYTSGTTGRPKGVVIEHRNVVRLLFNDKLPFDFRSSDVWTLFHSYCFDFSIWEMFGALLYGGKSIVVPKMVARDTAAFLELLYKETVTVLNQTPPAFYNLINEELSLHHPGRKLYLKYVIFGGDALNPSKLKEWKEKYPQTTLINMFGITETTVHVTFKKINQKETELNISNIGKPIPTLSVYILDKYLKPAPVGARGEIYVGGAGLGRGYLNRVELTRGKFIENPYKSGDCLYRSGDIGRFLANGDMEYLGRIDQQVKIRGFRIEPGEIESQLIKHEDIKEAVVLARQDENKNKYLCAFIISDKETVGTKLRDYLSIHLLDYMIPSYFMQIEKIPLTSNGKIDRKGFPDTEVKPGAEYSTPTNEVEEKLVELWSEILGIKKEVTGIDANFFELGGHSLKATMLVSKIHKELNVKIPLAEIFRNSTIRKLAGFIKGNVENKHVSIEPVEKKQYYALSSAQKRLYILQQMTPENTAYNISGIFVLQEEVDKQELEGVFRKMIDRHESLRTSMEIVGGEAVQRIYNHVAFKIENYDISGFNDKSEQEERIIGHFVRPFDLSRPPLFRVGVIKTDPGRTNQLLMVDMNHIITDGVSIKLLVWEFISLLARKELPRLKLQYKDYAVWQRGILEKEKGMMNQQEEYWVKEFSEEIPVLVLPTDYPRPQVQRFEGGKVSFAIGMEETRGLKKLAAQEQATLYMVLLAVFNILLSKLSNREIMVVGTAVAGRQHPNLEKIIGMFVNTVALKNHPSGGKSFIQFLGEVKENTLNAFDNQDYQFEELVEKIVVKRDRSRNPLFDVMFEMIGDEFDWVELANGKIRYYNEESQEYINPGSKFDMTLVAIDNTGPLSFIVIYNTNLFKEESIYRFVNALKHIIEKVTGDNKIPIAEINVFSASEGSEIAARLSDDLEIEMEA